MLAENKQRPTFELSNPQKRIWYVEHTEPGTPVFNLGGIVTFSGDIDFAILEQSIHRCLSDNDVFGLRIPVDGTARYYVDTYRAIPVTITDFTGRTSAASDFRQWADASFRTPFQFYDSPLYDFRFFKLPGNKCGYLIKMHHIIMDGWSVSLATSLIYQYYNAMKRQEPVTVEEFPSYFSFVREEQQYMQGERAVTDRSFWIRRFDRLNTQSLAGINSISEGTRYFYQLDATTVTAIRAFIKEYGSSLNNLFVAVMMVYLYKTTCEYDLTIGVPVANRLKKSEKNTIGMFTSTMPLRMKIDPSRPFTELLAGIRRELRACYAHQRYPYNHLVSDLELNKAGFNNLFQVCVNYYNTSHALTLDGMPVDNDEMYNGWQYYPMQLVIKEWLDNDTIQLQFDCVNKLYPAEKVRAIIRCFETLLQQILRSPDVPVDELSLLGIHESDDLLKNFNNTFLAGESNASSVLDLFLRQAKATPHNIAVSSGAQACSYQQFLQQVNGVAGYLQQQGVRPGDSVAVISNRSINYVTCIWAILMCGAAFVPVDPAIPASRREHILEQVQPALVVINTVVINTNKSDITAGGFKTVGIPAGDVLASCTCNFPVVSAAHTAYIIFTSGSTGGPKGILISHGNLANYIAWAARQYIMDAKDVFPFYSSISFDLTITSLFAPLICGAQIRVFGETTTGNALQDVLSDGQSSVIKLTPAHLSLIREGNICYPQIRTFVVGGELFSAELAAAIHRLWSGKLNIYNEYGPTEATVGCMIYRYNPQEDCYASVSIGRPISNTRIYVLNNHRNPLPLWHEGEIYIAGPGVAQGYLANPAATLSAFVKDNIQGDGVMYRTGDYGMFVSNDNILYLGRKDEQVKLRGYRIELQEIEHVMMKHDLVNDARVVLIKPGAGDGFLAAVLTGKPALTVSLLEKYLRNNLPEYMVPAGILIVPEMPLTTNGKVDQRVLKQLLERDSHDKLRGQESVWGDHCREALLILQEVLHVESIDVKDNFYFIGGDSIKAIQYISRLSAAGMKLSMQEMLAEPVVGAILRKVRAGSPPPVATACDGTLPTWPAAHWFLNRRLQAPSYYTQSVLLESVRPLSPEQLQQVFWELVSYHDSLRINLNTADNVFFYNTHQQEDCLVEVFDLLQVPADRRVESMKSLLGGLRSDFDLDKDLLIKMAIVVMEENKHMLFITAHHLVMDGVSLRILLEDLQMRLNGRSFLPKTASLAQWAEEFNTGYVKGAIPPPPAGCAINASEAVNRLEHGTIDKTLTAALSSRGDKDKYTTAELLLAAFAITLSETSGRKTLQLELEHHGRNTVLPKETDISRTIGWFTLFTVNTLDVALTDFTTVISAVKQMLIRAEDEAAGYTASRDVQRAILENHDAVRFNYMGDFDHLLSDSLFRLSDLDTGPDIAPHNFLNCQMEFNCYVMNGQVRMMMVSGRDQWSADAMQRFMHALERQLAGILRSLESTSGPVLAPEDFLLADISQSDLDALFI